MGMASGIPYANMLFLNVLQAIVAIFLASDFLKVDRKMDTTDVVYMRSMTNASYVLGKVIGVLWVFALLNLAALALGAIMTVFFSDMQFSAAGYVFYPLIISLPTLVYICGLTFLLMVLLRSQALVFVVMLGYIAATLFFLGDNLFGLLDFTAFGQAMAWSDFLGPGDIVVTLCQRMFFLLAGIALIMATVLLLRRLPQNAVVSVLCAVIFAASLAGAGVSGWRYLSHYSSGSELRAKMLQLNERYSNLPPVSIEAERITLDHRGNSINASAALEVRNNGQQPLENYRFSLNPGLNVTSVESGGAALEFERQEHILLVKPGETLASGMADSLTIAYEGMIEQAACYLDISDSTRYSPFGIAFFTAAKHYAIINPDYLLLTPEAGWYPASSLPDGPGMPSGNPSDFINFSLSLNTAPQLNAISPGVRDSLGDGKYEFETEFPLPRISLVAGEYRKMSITADSVEYALYIRPDHDFFTQYFQDIPEKLPEYLNEFRYDIENRVGLTYPFARLAIVETPIQFKTYDRPWGTTPETVQPEQVLVPEKGLYLQGLDFRRMNYYMNRGAERSGRHRDPEDMQKNMLNQFLRNSIGGSGMARNQGRVFRRSMGRSFSLQRIAFSMLTSFDQVQDYSMFPMFYGLPGNISSTRWPVLGMAFEDYMRKRLETNMGGFFSMVMGPTPEEEASFTLEKHPLAEVLTDQEFSAFRQDALGAKSDFLFGLVESEAGEKEFKEFTKEFLEAHRFTDIQADVLLDSINSRYGFELQGRLDNWLNECRMPSFLFGNTDCREVLDGNQTRYQVSLQVSNTGDEEGLLSLTSRAERGGGPGGRGGPPPGAGGPGGKQEPNLFRIAPGATMELYLLLDESPSMLDVDTYLSKNIPASLNFRLGEPVVDHDVEPFEGVRQLDEPLDVQEPGSIVVDNEDPGFTIMKSVSEGKLKKMLARQDSANGQYQGLYFWNPPRRWTATVYSDFFGTYRHSARYIRAGSGDNRVTWTASIPKSGQYDVYYHATKIEAPWMRRGRGGQSFIDDFNFTVYHDDGEEQVEFDAANEETGWVLLNTWYFSEGKAVVELSDRSKGRMVYADAVKWVEHR